jgi:Glycosyl transferase family 2/Glycosyl transferases group 1
MGANSFYRGQTAEAEMAALRERGYSVEYIDRILSEAEMAGLYCACDALVQPFRGEGFGLPIVEAMACGLPVIITGAGPALDYASDKTAYLIPAERQPLEERSVGGLETIDQPWLFEPDADALVELMKRVVTDRDDARATGTAASDHIRGQFTWARIVLAVDRRLKALTPGPMRPPTRSASEGPYQPSAKSSRPATRSASDGLYQPSANSSTSPTRSASEGPYQPSAKSSGPATRSASDGLHETREEREHPQPAGDCAAVLNGESCEPGQIPGTVAGSAGWAANASERMPILANASGWYVEPPSIALKSRGAASVSLTIIVKNEEENLPRCLASVEGIFDEIIIVDTGSTDRTKEIAREFGATVFDFEWVDSFAAARNEALSHATGNYAFWLDADDEVEPGERVKLLALIAGLKRPSAGGMASAMLPVTPPSPALRATSPEGEEIISGRRLKLRRRWTRISRPRPRTDPRSLRREKLRRWARVS